MPNVNTHRRAKLLIYFGPGRECLCETSKSMRPAWRYRPMTRRFAGKAREAVVGGLRRRYGRSLARLPDAAQAWPMQRRHKALALVVVRVVLLRFPLYRFRKRKLSQPRSTRFTTTHALAFGEGEGRVEPVGCGRGGRREGTDDGGWWRCRPAGVGRRRGLYYACSLLPVAHCAITMEVVLTTPCLKAGTFAASRSDSPAGRDDEPAASAGPASSGRAYCTSGLQAVPTRPRPPDPQRCSVCRRRSR
jgi:hypothetical protein